MKEILTDAAEIKKSILKFREILRDKSNEEESREWSFPNGEKDLLPTFSLSTTEGTLLVALPDKWEWGNRIGHLFCLEREGRALSPDVEINIPLEHNRSVSGVYIRVKDETWLCSRGIFTSFRGRMPQTVVFSHFHKWLAEDSDAGKMVSVIPVTALSSPTIAEDIAQFVRAVESLKDVYKKSGGDVPATTSTWGDWDEFEGPKRAGTEKAANEYEYMHGPLCNSLNAWLRKWARNTTLEIKKSKNIDAAIVRNDKALAIFEAKTSGSLSAQLYTAVGQLFYYRHRFGAADCALFLVLPESAIENEIDEADFFRELGISVIVRKDAEFSAPSGISLSRRLKGLKSR